MNARHTPRTAAARRYDAWRADAFHGMIAYEARQQRTAARLRRSIKLGALVGFVIGLAGIVVQFI